MRGDVPYGVMVYSMMNALGLATCKESVSERGRERCRRKQKCQLRCIDHFFYSVENVLYAIEEDDNVVHGVITAVTRSFVVSYKPESGWEGEGGKGNINFLPSFTFFSLTNRLYHYMLDVAPS